MKHFLFLLIAVISTEVHGHAGTDGDTGLKIGKCYPAYPSGYIVRKKDRQ
jgi:hypothetical protein